MSDAYILFKQDEANPIIHREGLPGLTVCMEYPFDPLFGAILVGTHKPNAPLCKECFDESETV